MLPARIRNTTPHVLFVGVLLVQSLPCRSQEVPQAGAGQNRVPSEWKIKGGRLSIGPETILLEQKDKAPLSIKTASVTGVCYDRSSHARGPSVGHATQEMGASSQGQGLILAPIVLPLVAGIHASKSSQHFVTIHWNQKDSNQDLERRQMAFQSGKAEYSSLLQALQGATNKPWVDVATRRKKLLASIGNWQSLAREKKGALHVHGTVSRMGSSVLDAYYYRAAIKEGPPGDGLLYLFWGDRQRPELAAVVRVSIVKERNSVSESSLVFNNQASNRLPQVEAIQLPTLTLKVASSQPYEYDPDCAVLPYLPF